MIKELTTFSGSASLGLKVKDQELTCEALHLLRAASVSYIHLETLYNKFYKSRPFRKFYLSHAIVAHTFNSSV